MSALSDRTAKLTDSEKGIFLCLKEMAAKSSNFGSPNPVFIAWKTVVLLTFPTFIDCRREHTKNETVRLSMFSAAAGSVCQKPSFVSSSFMEEPSKEGSIASAADQ